MKKYAHSVMRYLVIYTLGFAVLYIVRAFADVVYNVLSSRMPNVFPSYNVITDKSGLLSLEATLSFISAILTVFILTVFTVSYDNERYEFIISETDGFYTLSHGFSIYGKNYIYADVLASVLVPMPFFLIALIKLPENSVKALLIISDILGALSAPSRAFSDKLGLLGGAAVAVLVSLLSRIPAGYRGLKRWRGLWLSDIDRE